MAYFGGGHGLDIIIAIIPPLNLLFGFLKRLTTGHIIAAILNLVLAPLFIVMDFLTVAFSDKLVCSD